MRTVGFGLLLVWLSFAAWEAVGTCDTKFSCQGCHAVATCEWCPMTVVAGVRSTLQQKVGACVTKGDCVSSTATFDHFRPLLQSKTFNNTSGVGGSTVTFTYEPLTPEQVADSSICTDTAIDEQLMKDADCASCKKAGDHFCQYALRAEGSVDTTKTGFCLSNEATCSANLFTIEDNFLPAAKLLKNTELDCGNLPVVGDCAGAYNCKGCDLTTVDCEWCDVSATTTLMDPGKLSLYNGYCRSAGSARCDTTATEVQALKKFASASVDGQTSTLVASSIAFDATECVATPTSDPLVYDATKRTCNDCTTATSTWCATAFQEDANALGGACVADTSRCTTFKVTAENFGFASEAITKAANCSAVAPTFAPSTTAAPEPTTTSGATLIGGVQFSIFGAAVLVTIHL